MNALTLMVGVLSVVAGAGVAWRRLARTERREPVDLGGLVADDGLLPAAGAGPEPEPHAAREWPDPPASAWIAPPAIDAAATAPVPGEPDDLLFPQAAALLQLAPRMMDLEPAANPYEALRQRHERLSSQIAQAYAEVHRIRTDSLRRASEAEHSADLAASARRRAERVKGEIRRYQTEGRHRDAGLPDATDAFQDVHLFRVDALRRATEAERGADAVAHARSRAAKLLAEQRAIEGEMSRLDLTRRGDPARK